MVELFLKWLSSVKDKKKKKTVKSSLVFLGGGTRV
jgi:hypothetical protein